MAFIAILSFALLWTCANCISKEDCPSNVPRDKYTGVFGDKCYRFVTETEEEYHPAQSYCKSRNGNLAMPKSKKENDFLTNLLHSVGYHDEVWIGLNDIDDENVFMWVDGTHMDYSNWKDGDEGPRGGFLHPFQHRYEDCVAIDANGGTWADYRCQDLWIFVDEHKKFICEFQVKLTTTTTTTTTSTTTTPSTTTTTDSEEYLKTTTSYETNFPMDENSNSTNGLVFLNTTSSTMTTVSDENSNSIDHMHDAKTSISTMPSNSINGNLTSTENLPPLSSTTTGLTPESTTVCPIFTCDLDCGMRGIQTDPITKCQLCKCSD